ncbi:MAG: reprolysin-like metallopeptidase [Flavobacterium sp.]
MKKILLTVILLEFFWVEAQTSFFQPIVANEISNKELLDRNSFPREFQLFELNVLQLKQSLQFAPQRASGINSNVLVTFPNGKGELGVYRVYEAPVMTPEFQEMFPDNKSYIAESVQNPAEFIRFSITVFGFHGMVFQKNNIGFIDPYSKDQSVYMVYEKSTLLTNQSFECLFEDMEDKVEGVHFSPKNNQQVLNNTGTFRTYRLALASTEEYSQFHINVAGVAGGTLTQRRNAVIAAMSVTMTRVNGIFERDFALTMQMIPNLPIIFLLPENPDSLSNNSGSALINEIQSVIDAGVGFSSYDIGHVFSTGGGGIAQLNSPCSGNKARGVTGSSSPVGDPFDVDYVAHEMGHQYGATHTQVNNCQRTTVSAMEPGSASTIMGYAGICSPNVQTFSDAYFHAISKQQIDSFIAGGGNCSQNVANNNPAPIIQPLQNFTIPASTPFILEANANDPNGGIMTYCWEQMNNELNFPQPPQPGNAGGPMFRSIMPSLNSFRYFPTLSSILNGTNQNNWEVLPSGSRTLNFAVTVRDNQTILGGQTNRANLVVNTVATNQAFSITSPNSALNWPEGTNQVVTWNVAGTTANGINTPFVDIYLSTNGGQTFPVLLASQVPNDGSELISIPSTISSTSRIMVRGHQNIFLDISNSNFSITAATSSFGISFNNQAGQQNKNSCAGGSQSFDINYYTIGGFNSATNFSVSGLPTGVTAEFSSNNITSSQTIQLNINASNSVVPGTYQLVVTATSGSISRSINFYYNVFNAEFTPILLTSPSNQSTVNPINVNLSWGQEFNSTLYDVQVATDSAFSDIVFNQTTNQFNIIVPSLNSATTYYWRVRPRNDACSGVFSEPNIFSTIFCGNYNSSNVPIVIPTTVATVNSTLTIPAADNVVIQSITTNVQFTHTWINDVIVRLISPQGTSVRLLNRPCGNSSSFQNASATFEDGAPALLCTTSNPAIAGTIAPVDALSAFNGQNSQGVWTLEIQDVVNQDGGSLTNWSINICSNNVPLATPDITKLNFSVYPNPNNGSFQVHLPQPQNEQIQLRVLDMLGRVLFEKSSSHQGLLIENIRLSNTPKGVYLVQVQDGVNTETKKIIIE